MQKGTSTDVLGEAMLMLIPKELYASAHPTQRRAPMC